VQQKSSSDLQVEVLSGPNHELSVVVSVARKFGRSARTVASGSAMDRSVPSAREKTVVARTETRMTGIALRRPTGG
jgi:hypothetical protein